MKKIALAAAAAVLLLPVLIAGREPRVIDAAFRESTGATFLKLADGYTHYEVAGPADAREITVFVAGTTIPQFTWDRNFPALRGAGLRVLRYDLYGRGFSDRVRKPYDLDLFVRQLGELLDSVAPNAKANLVGVSLGGLIATEFASRHPARVAGLALIAPAGVGADLPAIAHVAMKPGIGEYIMRISGARQLRPSRRMFLHPDRYPEMDSLYLAQLSIAGTRGAVLSTLRNIDFSGYERSFAQVRAAGVPALLIWGKDDAVLAFSGSTRVRDVLQPARFVAVDEAGHFPQVEQPAVVNRELLEFFGQ